MREPELDAMGRGEIDPVPYTVNNLNRKSRRALAAERRRENRRVERLLARMQLTGQNAAVLAEGQQSLPVRSGTTNGTEGYQDPANDENAPESL